MTAAQDLSGTATLQAEHEALLAFLYLCPAGVVQSAVDGTVRLINPTAAQLLMPLVSSPDIDNLFDALEHCGPEVRHLAASFNRPTGSICQGHRIFISGNRPGPRVLSCSLLKISNDYLIAVLQDVTREVEQERQIKQSEALFAALMVGVNDFALFSLDDGGRINAWNGSGARLTGFRKPDVWGRDLDVLCHPDHVQLGEAVEQLMAAKREGWNVRETICRRASGEQYCCQILVAAVEGPSGVIESYAVVMRDVTERRMTTDELRRLLISDHLTGAANRARFFDVADRELCSRERTGRPLSVIVFDVDRFKDVNDAFGHATGDAVLRALVACCRTCLRDSDTLARLGGEEFAVLLPGKDLRAATNAAEALRDAVATRLAYLDSHAVNVTISLGCAEMTAELSGIDALLSAADQAMYQAKRAGRNQAVAAQPLLRDALAETDVSYIV